MNSQFVLKEKNDDHVIYYYSLDNKYAPSDGEIEFVFDTEEFNTLKKATGDDDGLHAKLFCHQHLWRIIFEENCPERRFFATG